MVVVIATIGLGSAVLFPAFNRSCGCGTSSRVQCGTNMHQILAASLAYAQQHGGALPDSIDTLKTSSPSYLAKLFVCPATEGTLHSGVQYIYAGKGLNVQTAAKTTIVFYEPLGNHVGSNGQSSINVARIDGSVGTYDQPQASKVIAELQSGHNPPRAEMMK